MSRARVTASVVAVALVGLAACGHPPRESATAAAGTPAPSVSAPATTPASLFPGMPPYISEGNVYAAAGAGMLSDKVRNHRQLVYVPNSQGDDVTVIDPTTFKVVDRLPGGPEPQHVVPSYDLSTLYVASSRVPSGGLVPIDPKTGKAGPFIPVQDVYNLYFTPDGAQAIVVAEYYKRLDFYDPRTWQRTSSVDVPECPGVNHMDYSADGRTMLFSCEFANRVMVLDAVTHKKLRQFDLDAAPNGMPQDTRLTPDGQHFLVADMHANGVYVFDGAATAQTGFIRTGAGTHGIYFSRDGREAYVTNRGEGSVTVLDLSTLRPVAKWKIPGGGSPDMGGVSADGSVLWLSGRYHQEVYAMSTADGKLLARIKVGAGPHGLVIWPQPGRYSLGHTANIR